MFDLTDDDEWFELGLALSGAIAHLPKGTTLIEALQIPPFRLAISATGTEMHPVVTRPALVNVMTPSDAVRGAIELAQAEQQVSPNSLAVAITQTNDGEHYAIAIVGIPGESKSWTTFGLEPGGHTIDVGYLILEQLEAWGLRQEYPLPAAA